MRSRWTLALTVIALWITRAPRAAFASPPPAEAERLFEDARASMARGDYAAACPKLERSEALDPGIGTQFNLARCYELSGRLASAWAQYEAVVLATHAAGETKREAVARGLADAIAPRIAHARIRLPPGAPPPGFELRCDGVEIEPRSWETPIPLDPGEHTVEATSPSATPFKTTFAIEREAQLVTVDVPLFATKMLLAPAPMAKPLVRESGADGTARLGAQRWVSISLAGLALGAAGVGTFYGLRALSRSSEAQPFCDATGCDPTGFGLRTEARSAAAASTLWFAIGGALSATAAVLWFIAPRDTRRTAWTRAQADDP